jgi:hypothetical protein
LFSSAIFGFAGHRCTQEWGAGGVRSEKLSHKNAIKYEKRRKRGPSSFSDNPKYPPEKNLAKTPGTPPPFPWISNYCASMLQTLGFSQMRFPLKFALGYLLGSKKKRNLDNQKMAYFAN